MQPREERIQKRIPCSIEFQGEVHQAIVLNLSRAGLFVQTRVSPRRGAKVAVALDSGKGGRLDLPTRVAWKRRAYLLNRLLQSDPPRALRDKVKTDIEDAEARASGRG